MVKDSAATNLVDIEEVQLVEYEELLAREAEMLEWESPTEHVTVE